jgi:hypothetical protein
MSGIGSVSSSTQSLAAEALQALRGQAGNLGSPETRLDQALQAAGIDEETRTALEGDLKAALDELMASGAFPPDPSTFKQTVDSVFEKYGLNAEDYMGRVGEAAEARLPEEQLDAALEAAGVDQQTRTALEADLKSALEDLKTSESTSADAESFQETIDAVFEKYGLNAEEFMPQPPAGGPPPGGPPPAAAASSDSSASTNETLSERLEELDSLLEQLQKQLNSQDDTSDPSQITSDWSQQILDTLLGIDTTA